jgi:hypothetical protein
MYGAGGWCRLNQYGDRYALSYDIWGYEWDGTNAHSHVYGYYDTDLLQSLGILRYSAIYPRTLIFLIILYAYASFKSLERGFNQFEASFNCVASNRSQGVPIFAD